MILDMCSLFVTKGYGMKFGNVTENTAELENERTTKRGGEVSIELKESDINHLRRLVAWVSCEIGLDEQESINLYSNIIAETGINSDEQSKNRIMASIKKSANYPQYVRRAIKSLGKAINKHDSGIVDADYCEEHKKIGLKMKELQSEVKE